MDPENKNAESRWLHQTTREHKMSLIANLREVKDFAYAFFDELDKDKDGFLDRRELLDVLENGELTNRQKSFVMFLLNNHSQISAMKEEIEGSVSRGISRSDLNEYFILVADLLA